MSRKTKERRFYVYFDKNVNGCDPEYARIVLPAGTSDEEANEVCEDELQNLINNNTYSACEELEEGEDWPEGSEE